MIRLHATLLAILVNLMLGYYITAHNYTNSSSNHYILQTGVFLKQPGIQSHTICNYIIFYIKSLSFAIFQELDFHYLFEVHNSEVKKIKAN